MASILNVSVLLYFKFYFITRDLIQKIHARGLSLIAVLACLGPCSPGLAWTVVWKDIQFN